MSLRYKPYKDKLAVFGDRKKYGVIMKNLGGRWNSRMGGEAGWNIPTKMVNRSISNPTNHSNPNRNPL